MNRPNVALASLICLYVVVALIALWRTIEIQRLDLFTIGVIPVLIGLVLRTTWAGLVLKIYLGVQTLAFAALAATAIIAYQITPEEVKVIFYGKDIPIPAIAAVALLLLIFQWWVAFSAATKQYLTAPRD
jgi:hypothetical protein